MANRYEILPLGAAEDEVAALERPLTITVTCSPRHGLDHTVDVAERVAARGHDTIVHLAARTVRDAEHLNAVLARLAAAGLDDAFLVAGDGDPVGPYASALELLPIVAGHRDRPRRMGIAAYPEGHPAIDPAALDDALTCKAPLADYAVTQMCFDPKTLRRWLDRTRARGIDLPLYVGIPGPIERRRLLEVSMRIGVGASIAFVRKQRGLRQLLGRPQHAADRLHDALAPLVGELGIRGLHYFTFNRLGATLAWERHRASTSEKRGAAHA